MTSICLWCVVCVTVINWDLLKIDHKKVKISNSVLSLLHRLQSPLLVADIVLESVSRHVLPEVLADELPAAHLARVCLVLLYMFVDNTSPFCRHNVFNSSETRRFKASFQRGCVRTLDLSGQAGLQAVVALWPHSEVEWSRFSRLLSPAVCTLYDQLICNHEANSITGWYYRCHGWWQCTLVPPIRHTSEDEVLHEPALQ